MATELERIEALELRVDAIEYSLSKEKQAADFSAAFSTKPIVPVVKEPPIPNTMFDPPKVVGSVLILAYIRFKDGYESWNAKRYKTDYIAEVRPYSEAEKAIMAKCGKVPEEGVYTTASSYEKIPVGAEIIRMVRNPSLPIPTGCKIADNEWELVPA